MGRGVTTRERVLLAFGILLVLLVGAAFVVRNEQVNSLNGIASRSLVTRRESVESALLLQNAEVQTVLSRARQGGAPESWLSSVDPNLVTLLIDDSFDATSQSRIGLSQTTIIAMLEGVRGSILTGDVPTEYWTVPHPKGTAIILRRWDTTRINLFQKISNSKVFFSSRHLSEPDRTTESVQVRRTLMSSAGQKLEHWFSKVEPMN